MTARARSYVKWTTPRPSAPWAMPAAALVCSSSTPREEWLAARKAMVCGSDIAKILHASKYGDAFSVWADKTSRAPEVEASDAMVRGSVLEEGVVDLWVARYADFPIEVRRQGLVRSRRYPHAGATVDRVSICELGRCLVEVKTQADIREWFDEDGAEEVPTAIQLQGQWQLGVTGRDHIHFVVLGPRLVPIHRIMYRDDELLTGERGIMPAVEEWWATYVVADVPPSPTHRSIALVRAMNGVAETGKRFVLDGETAALFRALPIVKSDAEAATQAYEDTLAQLQALIGDATEILWEPGDTKPAATWRPGKTIDGATKAFIAENPELVEPYMRLVEKLDVDKLIAEHPELLADGRLRRRRTWSMK